MEFTELDKLVYLGNGGYKGQKAPVIDTSMIGEEKFIVFIIIAIVTIVIISKIIKHF